MGAKMMEKPVIIEAKNLIKDYGKLRAANDVDLQILEAECFGFLGPNGAGKTTIMKMIYCVLPITSGELHVSGMSVKEKAREIKALIGVSPQEINLDPDFTVLKNLIVYSRYFDISETVANERANELLKFFDLNDKKDTSIDELSTGMKRRLILARALINNPRILILDEPTTGLDPQARHLIWERVRDLRNMGVTIILTTHYMEEAFQLCDRIAIMDSGKIVEEGVPKELVKKHVGEDVLEISRSDEALAFLKSGPYRYEIFGDRINIFTDKPEQVLSETVKEVSLKETVIRKANLEDVFLKLTGRRLRD